MTDLGYCLTCELHGPRDLVEHDAGYTQVYVHQIGPDQEGFFRFYEREILPKFS
jgi:hypothetical protein